MYALTLVANAYSVEQASLRSYRLSCPSSERDGAEVGLDAETNARLDLGSKVRIHGGRIALRATSNLELRLRSAALASDGIGLCASSNISIHAFDSSIQGGAAALRVGQVPEPFELVRTELSGPREFGARDCSASGNPSSSDAPVDLLRKELRGQHPRPVQQPKQPKPGLVNPWR